MNLMDQLFRRTEALWFDSADGREGNFDAVAVSGGKRIAVVGTRLAREGIAFVSSVAVRGDELPLTFTIRRRTIPSRVRIIKDEPVRAAQRILHRYLCSFTAIAEADRDAVVRYVENRPEPALDESALEDSGSLSARVRGDIADRLVQLKRLAPPAPGMAPLIRLDAQTVRELEDGRRARDVVVHSRLRSADGVRSFQTKFRVYADDRIEVLS
jgi:hypothetical protein